MVYLDPLGIGLQAEESFLVARQLSFLSYETKEVVKLNIYIAIFLKAFDEWQDWCKYELEDMDF